MPFFWRLCHPYSTRVMSWGFFDWPIENSSFTDCIVFHKFGQTRTKLKSLRNKMQDIWGHFQRPAEKALTYQGRMYDLNATSVLCKSLFWASGDNLDLERPGNSCKQVDYVTGIQGKPRCCRALTAAKGPQIWFNILFL